MALAKPLDPAWLAADVAVPLAQAAGPGPRANAVVLTVDLDLLGDGRHVVHDGADSLARRQGVAFFHAPDAAAVFVRTHLRDDGELSVTLHLK